MKSFMPMPQRMILWKCPDCGKEDMTTEKTPPWIYTCRLFSFGNSQTPICPKCKKKMIKVKLFY